MAIKTSNKFRRLWNMRENNRCMNSCKMTFSPKWFKQNWNKIVKKKKKQNHLNSQWNQWSLSKNRNRTKWNYRRKYKKLQRLNNKLNNSWRPSLTKLFSTFSITSNKEMLKKTMKAVANNKTNKLAMVIIQWISLTYRKDRNTLVVMESWIGAA